MVVEHNHLHRVYKCVVRSPIMVSFHPPNKVVSYVKHLGFVYLGFVTLEKRKEGNRREFFFFFFFHKTTFSKEPHR